MKHTVLVNLYIIKVPHYRIGHKRVKVNMVQFQRRNVNTKLFTDITFFSSVRLLRVLRKQEFQITSTYDFNFMSVYFKP